MQIHSDNVLTLRVNVTLLRDSIVSRHSTKVSFLIYSSGLASDLCGHTPRPGSVTALAYKRGLRDQTGGLLFFAANSHGTVNARILEH